MAKGVFNASVFMGRPLYPADITTTVSVYNAETDELAPTLWLDRDGTDELANPHPLSEDGVILFYADPGRYNIIVEKGTMLYREWPDVIISDSPTIGTPGIQSVVAGTNISVDDTDPLNPIISATGDTSRDAVHTIASASGVVTLNVGLYNYFLVEMAGDITVLNLTGVEPGKAYSVAVQFVQSAAGGHQIAWPSSFQFTKGSETEISDTPGSYNLLGITTLTDGYRWIATLGVQDS